MCFSFAEHCTVIGSTETRVTSSTNQNQSRLWRVHFAALGVPGVGHVYFCMLLTGIMIRLWLRFMSRDSSQDSLKPRGEFSLRWNLPWPSSLTWLSNNSLKLYLLCPYLAWRLFILANISTWPVEYCSITSLTSYGLLASCTTRKYRKDDKKVGAFFN